ncbi:N-6 DNA methylase [Acinetobacter pittii]|uniref:N-6 DNA methylase n=1 Tax=Acinetobacter pittii TaxID=48296 RepID=UPI003AF9FB6E
MDTTELSFQLRQKRLGQYFTPPLVGRLLASLTSDIEIKSVIDPMAGQGDLLRACIDVLPNLSRVHGIEIDYAAYLSSLKNIKTTNIDVELLNANAFSEDILKILDDSGYDLVIANPPYVRYQSFSDESKVDFDLPNATEIRKGLIGLLEKNKILSNEDKKGFIKLAEGYSGLSDLAVPAWILCASLVKVGGKLAMVVPESWLKRDYANVIQYLLTRWFQLEYIVEDRNSSWFENIQVKTNLIVAKRINAKESINSWGEESFIYLNLDKSFKSESSLTGKILEDEKLSHEYELMCGLKNRKITLDEEKYKKLEIRHIKISDYVQSVITKSSNSKWFSSQEGSKKFLQVEDFIMPNIIKSWLEDFSDFTTLGAIGIEVGQGLRTGANDFFYAKINRKVNEDLYLQLSKLFNNQEIVVPEIYVDKVVRKQIDLPAGYIVDANELEGVVFSFQNLALPEDAELAQTSSINEIVAEYIRCASKTYADKACTKLIPELSAVKPNIRKPTCDKAARYWYMLPKYASRHKPDLLIPRVNAKQIKTYLNKGKVALVDANFNTIWLNDDAKVSKNALLAILNSKFTQLIFEYIGAIMGGGALKIEATHIKKIPLPIFNSLIISKLDQLGSQLNNENSSFIISEINDVILEFMFGERKHEKNIELNELIYLKKGARGVVNE